MKLLFLLSLLIMNNVYGFTFQDAIKSIASHENVKSLEYKSNSISEEGRLNSSWGDPMLKIAAKNFPKDNLKNDVSPMTGLEVGISQKIPLSTKFNNINNKYKQLASATLYESQDAKQYLIKKLWEILINQRKLEEELNILLDNKNWIEKMLKVSKKLYSTGKTSQQAILDIQIRNSEIENAINNKKYDLLKINDEINYLVGSSIISKESIPWKLFNKEQKNKVKVDLKELALKSQLNASNFELQAARLNYIPDMNVSIGLTKREYNDGNGDFVSASISLALPTSSIKYAYHEKASQYKLVAEQQLNNYKKTKNRDVSILEKEINKIKNEIDVLESKTIKFANTSREIISKAYGLGSSSYVELLQSEIKLQNILLQKINLEASLNRYKLDLKYILGEALNE